MSEIIEQCKIELSGEDIETIVEAHIISTMEKKGYELESGIKQDGEYWPSMLYRGNKKQV